MMFELRRLHFIREEDKICAKLSGLFILTGLRRASGDSGKQCSVSVTGVHNASVIRPDATKALFTVLYVTHKGP